MKLSVITLIFISFSLSCLAQFKISGRILNQADTKPVANASVFISNATIGSQTGNDGTFTLQNVKPGKYELVVSIIGFDIYDQTIIVNNADINLPDIIIFPKSIALNEVKIKAERYDPDRARYYEWFKGGFLGTSDIAKECKILNPEVLDFKYDKASSTLTASSVDFLIIENQALGYNIKYLLKDFMLSFFDDGSQTFNYSGSVLFDEMKGNSSEKEQWQKRRQEVYEGSGIHFLRAAIANELDQQGFRVLRVERNPRRPVDSLIDEKLYVFQRLQRHKVYRDSLNYWIKMAKLPRLLDKLNSTPLSKADILKGPDKKDLYTLSSNGDGLLIIYNKYSHYNRRGLSQISSPTNQDNTLLAFKRLNILFDRNGTIFNPQDIIYDGVWGHSRVSSLLPLDYEPQQNKYSITDSTVVKNVTAKLNAYDSIHVAEKIYLHFDKPYYASGDTMYFKAYVTQGRNHEPSHLSGVLYADLINPENKISRSLKLLVTDGTATGDFALSNSLPEGNYRIRAYTQWMKNEGEEGFFSQVMAIGSTISKRIPESGDINKTPVKARPDISFFPEGGSLVASVRSKVAFKAIGANGLGVDVKGVVFDSENQRICAFASTHLGMGYFYLTPAEAKNYKAKITYSDGTEDIINLPVAGEQGINISATDLSRSFAVKISCNKAWYQAHRNNIYTLVINSGDVLEPFAVKLQDKEITLEVSKRDLHSGIAKATLFSSAGEPMCERLLFVKNNDQLALNISSDKNKYSVREKTSIKLNVTTGSSASAPGHFSVAVIDENKVPVDENAEPTIINNLLLTSELKGYIEQPNYYFASNSDKTNADLDLVMLTHGYRRFEWKKIFNNINQPISYEAEKGLTISGHVKLGGKPVVNGKVKLLSKGKDGMMLDTLTDVNGKFVFDNLAFTDTTKFVIQARTAKDQKDVEITPDTGIRMASVAPKSAIEFKRNNNLDTYIHSSKQFLDEKIKFTINKNENMLKEVVIKDKKATPFEHSQNLNGAGNADQILTAEYLDNAPYNTLYDALKAKLTSVYFVPETHFPPEHRLRSTRSIASLDGKQDYMVIIVDGVPQITGDKQVTVDPLDDFAPADIESVEVLLGTHYGAVYGSIASGGAILITTKRGKRVNNYYRYAPGLVIYKGDGFYKEKEFYAPKYDHLVVSNMQDLRTTIFWKPEITTDKDGNASFEYFNADSKGTYRLVVEGIDADGNIGRQVYRYTVE